MYAKKVSQNSLQDFSVHLHTKVQSNLVPGGPVSSKLDQTVTDPASFSVEESTFGMYGHGYMIHLVHVYPQGKAFKAKSEGRE